MWNTEVIERLGVNWWQMSEDKKSAWEENFILHISFALQEKE